MDILVKFNHQKMSLLNEIYLFTGFINDIRKTFGIKFVVKMVYKIMCFNNIGIILSTQ